MTDHNPIDKDHTTETPNTLQYAHTRGGAIVRPEDQGKLKSRALSAMDQQTDMQMAQIQEQITLLAAQAKTLNDRKIISEWIYMAEMRFEPYISHIYHLYQKDNGAHLLSLIGPTEWGRSTNTYTFIATVKLLADHTWDILDKSPDFEL
jgi:Protein of unknown function (DUF2452)